MRFCKTVSLGLLVFALSLCGIGCGSGNTQYRVIDVIPTTPAGQGYDVLVNGSIVTPTGGIGFANSYPSSGYHNIPSGGNSIEVFPTDTTTNPLIASTSLNLADSTQYTVLLIGRYASSVFPPTAALLTDNNTAPTTGNGEIRVVQASTGWPQYQGTPTADIYITAQGTTCPGVVPVTVSGLEFGQASPYTTEPAASTGQGYTVCATPHNSTIPFAAANPTLSEGEIITVVLVDNTFGQPAASPLIFTDLK